MSFTDDDLKRLKEHIEISICGQPDCPVTSEGIKRFVARLEAAEANMGGHSPSCPREIGKCICTKEARDKAWRTAAGRLSAALLLCALMVPGISWGDYLVHLSSVTVFENIVYHQVPPKSITCSECKKIESGETDCYQLPEGYWMTICSGDGCFGTTRLCFKKEKHDR